MAEENVRGLFSTSIQALSEGAVVLSLRQDLVDVLQALHGAVDPVGQATDLLRVQ